MPASSALAYCESHALNDIHPPSVCFVPIYRFIKFRMREYKLTRDRATKRWEDFARDHPSRMTTEKALQVRTEIIAGTDAWNRWRKYQLSLSRDID